MSITQTSASSVTIEPCGAAGLRIDSVGSDRETNWRLVHLLSRQLRAQEPDGYLTSIPTYESVFVEYDPFAVSESAMVECVRDFVSSLDTSQPVTDRPRHFDVPVLYGGDAGPDLPQVADITGLCENEVIRLHSERTYTVRCFGSPGGSPMLDGPAFPVSIPRLKNPRPRVRAGVVSVAGRQATVAPAAAPGGWLLLGHTPLKVLDLSHEPLVPYVPGDSMSFRPIGRDEYERLEGSALAETVEMSS